MMAKGGVVFGLATLLLTSTLAAAAPEKSLRPIARPNSEPEQIVSRAAVVVSLNSVRPVARPGTEQITLAAASTSVVGPNQSLRPYLRPKSLEKKVFLFNRKKRKGSVCGDIDIQGQKVGKVPGKIKGCGVTDAVRVTSIDDVRLSTGAIMTCDTAKSLKAWVQKGVKPAFKPIGRISELKVAAHYACRTRNNQRGARISEHGKGRAIDISAFTTDTGQTITVAQGWRGGRERKALIRAWQSACGPFGTVLGPRADRFHRDHFHMDTATYRSGTYCR
ncbi:MAG: extensin family protein [Pseudomonadota bacterium]